MYKKIKKVLVCLMTFALTFQTMNLDVLAIDSNTSVELNPGEVTQNKTAKWVDYSKGIAEISFDVTGKNAEEPLDVAIVYDNSGSMQISSGAPQANGNTYLTSRWNYASLAAKQLSANLLKNASNNIAFIPFSDVLIDGNSLHKKEILPNGDKTTTDFFENHKLIYDEFGNPNISIMWHVLNMYGPVEKAETEEQKNIALAEFYEICESKFGLKKEDLAEANNTQNALVPFTNNLATITNAIDSLYPANAGQTNYEVALKKAKEYLESSNNRKVILMISDGKPNRGDSDIALAIAEELKASGVTIYTVGTGISEADATMLKQIASKDSGKALYTSADPSELNTVLESLRKQFEVAASDGVIEDEINTEYFEYYTDDTHVPTVNGVALGSNDFIVTDNSKITWKIGDIRETTKTLRFYVKVKDTLLNDDLLSMDASLLNKEGAYKTNIKANLSYKEINTGNTVNSGHEMTSPSLGVDTASMKVTYYLSDGLGNIVKDKGQNVILKETTFTNKALHVPYEITPENKIIIDGETYFIYKDDNNTRKKTFTEEDTDKLYHVEFRLVKQLNVTFDTNGNGTFENSEKTTELLVDHSTMKVPSLPEIKDIPNDKVFVGWNTDKGGLGKEFTSNTEVNKNMTVYAQWKDKDKYMVIFKDGDNVLGRDSVYAGEDATAPKNVVKEGYTFDKWDKEFNNIKSDLEVNAIFTANKYTVKFDGNGADSGTMTNQEFVYDQTQSLKKNTFVKENYTFTGWLYNGTTYTDEQEVKNLIATNGGEVTLVAQWKENDKFKVTFTDGFGTELKEETVYVGKDATAPANPTKEGYTFKNWDKDFTNVTENLTVNAVFEANTYTVKFDGNGQDSGTMADQGFVYDQEQKLTKNAFVKENYTFTGWTYKGTTYTDEEEVMNLIATNGGIVTLVAQWTENTKYTVTFVDGLGTVLDTQSVYKGKDATAPTAPERAGYTFLGWDLEFTNVSKNLTITALWEAEDTDTPVIPDTPVTPDTPNQPGVPTTPVPPIVPIVRTDPVVTPPAPVQPVQPVQPNPAPQEPEIVVPDNDTPEVKVDDNDTPKAKSSASWALINLICSILTVLLVIVIVLGKRKKEEEDEDEDETIAYKRRKWTMIAGAVVALGSVITFILTENIFLPMILVDKWTLLMAAILLVQVVVLVLAKKWKKEDNEEEATAQA